MRRTTILAACSLTLLAACSSSTKDKGAPTEETYLGLTQPENGFQVRNTGMTVQPGEDVEYCEVAELPGDPSETYYVNRIEFGNGKASHHLIVNAAEPGSVSDEKLRAMKIGDKVACLAAGSVFGEGLEFTGGVQRPYGDLKFPEGVGRIYHGGQRIVFDFHYYNTTDEPVEARSAMNMHLTKAADVKHIAQVVGFNNTTIDTPAGQKASFIGECHYTQDVLVSSVTRHTHRWGTDFKVWYAGGANDGQEFWTSHDFEEDTLHTFDQPLLRKAGEGFRFQCDYDNTESKPLRFGLNATDEMCILFSLAWEADEGEQLADQNCSIVMVDDQGVGRPVTADQGFRTPTQAEVDACLAQSPLDATCSTCACGSCGGVIADCVNDADCGPLLTCVRSTGCDQNSCGTACGDVFNAHSSGIGMLLQLSTCMSSSCADTCGSFSGGGSGADAGTP